MEPWIQFVILYFGGGFVVSLWIDGLCSSVRNYESPIPGFIVLAILIPLIWSPILIGVYFTYRYVYGWWNVLLWLSVLLMVAKLEERAKQAAQ